MIAQTRTHLIEQCTFIALKVYVMRSHLYQSATIAPAAALRTTTTKELAVTPAKPSLAVEAELAVVDALPEVAAVVEVPEAVIVVPKPVVFIDVEVVDAVTVVEAETDADEEDTEEEAEEELEDTVPEEEATFPTVKFPLDEYTVPMSAMLVASRL